MDGQAAHSRFIIPEACTEAFIPPGRHQMEYRRIFMAPRLQCRKTERGDIVE